MRITEDMLREAIREVVLEALSEGGTNMASLYHFTDFDALPEIIMTGSLKTNQWQKEKRNNKRFISFTRHRSLLEGFGKARRCTVRIEVDGRALSNVRSSDVYPYEYYNPNSVWSKRNDDQRTAAEKYRDGVKIHGVKGSGEFEYMHQAEESFETDLEYIDIKKIVKSIDVLVPNNFAFRLKQNQYGAVQVEECFTKCWDNWSPLINMIRIYDNERYFNLQKGVFSTFYDFYTKYLAKEPMRAAMEEGKR